MTRQSIAGPAHRLFVECLSRDYSRYSYVSYHPHPVPCDRWYTISLPGRNDREPHRKRVYPVTLSKQTDRLGRHREWQTQSLDIGQLHVRYYLETRMHLAPRIVCLGLLGDSNSALSAFQSIGGEVSQLHRCHAHGPKQHM